jgi:hypothetical protein
LEHLPAGLSYLQSPPEVYASVSRVTTDFGVGGEPKWSLPTVPRGMLGHAFFARQGDRVSLVTSHDRLSAGSCVPSSPGSFQSPSPNAFHQIWMGSARRCRARVMSRP